MTGKAAVVQGGLAVLGLALAYSTSTREPERAPGEVVILDASKGDIGNVHFEDDTNAVDLQRRSEGGGDPAVWLHVVEKPPAPPAPPKDGAKPLPPPPPKTLKPPRDLRGDPQAEKLLDQMSPLRSPRSFGVLDAAKSKELGLDAPKKKLTITVRGQAREFVIGQPPQGSGENYIRDLKDGRTYLMPRSVLSDLQGAAYRLIDRRVHTFKVADVDRLAVTAGGKTRELVLLNRESASGYKLAPAKTPDKPDELARNWHDKIWRIYPIELLGKGEKPAAGEPKVAVRVEYFDGRKSAGWIEIGKLEPTAPTPPSVESTSQPVPSVSEPPKPEFYARTEHTAGWIKIHGDPSYVADSEKVASGS
jgi:hypothetical protein